MTIPEKSMAMGKSPEGFFLPGIPCFKNTSFLFGDYSIGILRLPESLALRLKYTLKGYASCLPYFCR